MNVMSYIITRPIEQFAVKLSIVTWLVKVGVKLITGIIRFAMKLIRLL